MMLLRYPALALALTLFLLLLARSPVSAGEPAAEPPQRILVTFDAGPGGKATGSPVPGKSYRYRTRYRVRTAVRKNAREVAADYDLKAIDDWPITSLKVYCVVYAPPQSASLPALLKKLLQDARVESAQLMHRYESMSVPNNRYNDTYAGFQHGLASMSVIAAHRFADGKGVKIAVIDSGVDLRHEEFRGQHLRLRDFLPAGYTSSSAAHGTAVVSLIIANPNNGKGIVGVAPGAKVTALRACWSNGDAETALCDSFTLAKALDFLLHAPPDLINLSFAGPRDPLLGRLIDKVLQNGTIIVAARPTAATAMNTFPAGYRGVLAVSSASAGVDANASHTGHGVPILSPGEEIMVALPNNGYDFRSGSSLAAANASGVIALLLQMGADLDGARIGTILRKSQLGSGPGGAVINACRALAEIEPADACR